MRRTLAVLILLALPACADPPIVERIELEGLQIHTREEVIQKMRTRVGRPFEPDELDMDLVHLSTIGWFANVWEGPGSRAAGPGGVTIVLVVEENDVLKEVRYEGNRHFSDTELNEGLHLKIGQYFAMRATEQDRKRIHDKYLEDGYAFVSVEAVPTAGEKGAAVTFRVREGPRVRVSDIVFHGLKNLGSFKMKREMLSKERTLLSILSPPVYRKSQLEMDMGKLVSVARDEGYLDARVYVRELVWEREKGEVDIHIQVDEGIRYVVDSVTIEGNDVVTLEALTALLRVKAGSPYALKEVAADHKRLFEAYWEKAYVDASVLPDRGLPKEPGHVNLTWRIREGEKVYVGRIDFAGNTNTRERVLRRELKLFPGEELNWRHLKVSVDHLKSLGFFEPPGLEAARRAWHIVYDPIIIVEERPGNTPQERDILISVAEGRTGNFSAGASYSGASGITGRIQIIQRNFDIADLPGSLGEIFTGEAFTGASQILRLTLQPGARRDLYELSFTEPWIFGYPIAATLAGTRFDQNLRFYRERRLSGTLDLSHSWDDWARKPESFDLGVFSPVTHIPGYFLLDDLLVRGFPVRNFWERGVTIGASYRASRINITDVDNDAPGDVFDVQGENYLSSLTLRVSADRRDSRVFPTRGMYTYLSYEYAGHYLGGDFTFFKVLFRNEAYTPLYTSRTGGKTVFKTDVRGGFARAWYHSQETPIFERFYGGEAPSSGGFGYLRGFESRTISPKDGDDPIGGNVLLMASAEFHFPLFRTEMFGEDIDIVRGAVFTDWGTVVPRWEELGDYRWSVGFGVRIQIPLGAQRLPISLDFGFPLRKESDDDKRSIHVGFDLGF